jgi:aspartyl-tRNA(Asn)/glutamyl-tRNA(Gln) amidotransferase subunit B
MEYEVVIGLEVHAQLSTETKIFCGCSTKFGAEPNSQTCPVCLGMPGVLPVLNKKVVESAVKMGIATNSKILKHNVFARKNYFYPDLPKGYQISQFEEPICLEGSVEVETEKGKKTLRINRIHMEEDAGKSVHDETYIKTNDTFIDLNRCGVPLIEIVSEPDMRSPQEAYAYLVKLRQLVRYLDICDGNMEEGSFRCDANISIRPRGQEELGVKTELKNMNSFRNVERALEYEIKRQIDIVQDGGKIVQETLLWDPAKNVAKSMRSKEESHDYRYFPEPDLPTLDISAEWIEQINRSMPELPEARKARFINEYGQNDYNASVLTTSRETADYYEETVKGCGDAKLAANWVMGEVSKVLNEKKIQADALRVTPVRLAGLLKQIKGNVISASAAKKVFDAMLDSDASVDELIQKLGLKQVSDEGELEKIIDEIMQANPKEVEGYRAGKTKLIGFFVGQVMRASKGKANPQVVNQILQKKLSNDGK